MFWKIENDEEPNMLRISRIEVNSTAKVLLRTESHINKNMQIEPISLEPTAEIHSLIDFTKGVNKKWLTKVPCF